MRLDSDVIKWLKSMAAAIRPKPMGFCGTPCFITWETRVWAAAKASGAVRKVGKRKRQA